MAYKIVSAGEYDIEGRVAQLEALAENGWFPASFGFPFMRLKRGEPRKMRYHFEPARKDGPDEAMLAMFSEAGWELLGKSNSGFYIFGGDADSAEPYSDSESMAEALTELCSGMRRRLLTGVGVVLFFCCFLVALSRWAETDLLARLPAALIGIPLAAVLLLFWGFLRLLGAARRYSRMRKAMADGVYPEYRRRFSPKFTAFCNAAHWALLFIAAVVLWCGKPLIPLPESYPQIGDIVEITEPVDVEMEVNGISILAPVQYYVEQYAEAAQGDDVVMSHVTLKMYYYRLTIPAMARAIAMAQFDVLRFYNYEFTYRDVEYPGADLVIIGSSEGSACSLAAILANGRLAVFSCYGGPDLAEHLDVLAGAVGC